MKVFIMRHAEADSGPQIDPTRELTPTGKRQAKMMSKWLSRQIAKPDLVIESNMKRSHQTAKRMAKRLDAEIIRSGKIDPDLSPESAWRAITQLAYQNKGKTLLVVTHGPLIEKLFALLTGGLPDQFHVAPGSISHFDTDYAPLQEAAGDYTYDEQEMKRLILGSGGASGENCAFCEEAADRGWIDMDDVFDGPMGEVDDAPLHPNCDCTVEQATKRVRVYENGVRFTEGISDGAPFKAQLHWIVTPNTVARDEDEQDLLEAQASAALELAEAALEMVE